MGRWLKGDYAISGERRDLSEEEQALLDKQTKAPTLH